MKKRGRKERSRYERVRIKIWALAVYTKVKERGGAIEEIIGKDGAWESLWSRYYRGLVAPSTDRLNRIEAQLPGTAIYYTSPIWSVASDIAWNAPRISKGVESLCTVFYNAFVHEMELRDKGASEIEEELDYWEESYEKNPTAEGDNRIKELNQYWWRTEFYHKVLLTRAYDLLLDPQHGMDALSTIFLAYQECFLQKDDLAAYHFSLVWAAAEIRRREHPLLRHIPTYIFSQALEPLRKGMELGVRKNDLSNGQQTLFELGTLDLLSQQQKQMGFSDVPNDLFQLLDSLGGYLSFSDD